jgi:hypothetical protein
MDIDDDPFEIDGEVAFSAAHVEHEDHPWTIQIPDHPRRTESAEYVASRRTMNRIAREAGGVFFGPAPYQDHHGGGLWLKDADGWFLVRNLVGIEWSAQFCADPAKVDQLRLNARRLYATYPDAVAELGIRDLLDTPITDAEGVARWTDSICNASLPLPAPFHTGVLPHAPTGGVHHYPTPIAEIELIKRDDFNLWVETPEGDLAAVVPVAPPGSGDGRTRLMFAATPFTVSVPGPIERLTGGPTFGGPIGAPDIGPPGREDQDDAILSADNPLSLEAFARQG